MNKFTKIFLVSFLVFGVSGPINSNLQYDSNTNVYSRKRMPAGKQSGAIKNQPSDDIYKNYGVRTAVAEEKEAEAILNNSRNNNNPGHTLNNSKSTNNRDGYQQKSVTSSVSEASYTGENFGGYNVRKVKTLEDNKKAVLAEQSRNAMNNDSAYKSARTLNFDALRESNRGSKRSTSYYSDYYGSSLKIYNQRGQRVSPTISNINRTVIIVPRQGITVTGTVTSDDPGRSITIKDNDGKNLTYQYTEMDALVNI